MNKIHINQLGYRPSDTKKAVIPQNESAFRIVRVHDGTEAFTGAAENEAVYYAASGDTVRITDFSAFMEKGEYALCTGDEKSYPFAISDNPYAGLRAALLEMLNYQKCGADIDCGIWSHPACHHTLATVYGTDVKKDVSGGAGSGSKNSNI